MFGDMLDDYDAGVEEDMVEDYRDLDAEKDQISNYFNSLAQKVINDYKRATTKNKICIYAIAKDEIKSLERWISSMSEADYIVVLDTGSTDGTYEALMNDKRIFRVEQKIIKPWRFDVARNESMKLIPDDANILICTDIDEIFEPGWANVIREKWVEGVHVRGHYKYAWSHNDDGTPGRIFTYDKMHDRNWKWVCAVHEMLTPTEESYTDQYINDHIFDVFDEVYLHHYQLDKESRSDYLPLLRIRVEENPNDHYGKYYLACEYYYRKFYHESIALIEELLDKYSQYYSNLEVAALYLFEGDNYEALGYPIKAIYYYDKSIAQEPTYREPYLYSAQLFNQLSLHKIAIGYVEAALENSYRHYSWVERNNTWNEMVDDILAISYYYIGEYELSYHHAKLALAYNNQDERLKNNVKFIEAKLNEKGSNK